MKYLSFFLLILMSIVNCGQINAQVTNGLTNWISFNGSAADSVGNLNGTVNGAVLDTGRGGVVNGAYFFDGIDDYIDFGTVDPGGTSGDISICIWFYPSTAVVPADTLSTNRIANNEYLFSSGAETSSIGHAMIWSKGKIECLRKTSSKQSRADQVGYANNSWHQLCMTYNDSLNRIKMYLDGVLRVDSIGTSGTYSNSFSKVVAGRASAYLGRNDFHGLLDDIKIYDRVLSSQDIDSLYNPPLVTSIEASKLFLEKIQLFPNPTRGNVNLYNPSLTVLNGRVFDLLGNVVIPSFSIGVGNNEVNLTSLNSGIYIINLSDGQRNSFQKFIKQ